MTSLQSYFLQPFASAAVVGASTQLGQNRARILTKWSNLIGEHSNDLAGLMCLESGKPKAEAKGEINYARSFITLYAGMQSNGLVIPPQTENHLLLATKEVEFIRRQDACQ